MQQFYRVFYESSNGDRWTLGRRPGTRYPYVVHTANEPSGGAVAKIDVGAFLRRGHWNAEQQALLELIGTLVPENDSSGDEPVVPGLG